VVAVARAVGIYMVRCLGNLPTDGSLGAFIDGMLLLSPSRDYEDLVKLRIRRKWKLLQLRILLIYSFNRNT